MVMHEAGRITREMVQKARAVFVDEPVGLDAIGYLEALADSADACRECGGSRVVIYDHITPCPVCNVERSPAASGWVKSKPAVPGAYYVRGFRLGGQGSRPALVEVDHVEGIGLVSNLHAHNSDDDVSKWAPIDDHADRFEWLGPLLTAAPATMGSGI